MSKSQTQSNIEGDVISREINVPIVQKKTVGEVLDEAGIDKIEVPVNNDGKLTRINGSFLGNVTIRYKNGTILQTRLLESTNTQIEGNVWLPSGTPARVPRDTTKNSHIAFGNAYIKTNDDQTKSMYYNIFMPTGHWTAVQTYVYAKLKNVETVDMQQQSSSTSDEGKQEAAV